MGGLQGGSIVGKQIVVTDPHGQRFPVRVTGYHGQENGFSLEFPDMRPGAFTNRLQRQGWQIPKINVTNNRQNALQAMAKTQRPEPNKADNPDKKREEYLAKRRKASALRHSVAHEDAALIARALIDEDISGGFGDREQFERRPGGTQDPWRQSGFGKPNLKGAKFTGKRPGGMPTPAKPASAKPQLSKFGNRMNWKPGDAAPAAKAPDSGKLKLPKDRMKWKPTDESLAVPEPRP